MAYHCARRRPPALASMASVLGLVLVVSACGGNGDGDGDGDGDAAAPDSAECEAYADYQGNEDTEVSIYSPIREGEADRLEESWAEFVDCTGIDIAYEGSGEFEVQLNVRVDGGNPPDIAIFPQPGLLAALASEGHVVPASEQVEANVDEFWSEDWKGYGTVDDTFYAAPLLASVKSFVWYSPSMFSDAGYEIPETWDDMIALSDQIVADNPDVKPWCAGIASGDATGWVATDWMEDVMLREHGPEVYDQWVNHEIPFNDPQVVEVLDRVGGVLKNEAYVNGGFGDVRSIAATTFQDAGLPILDGDCYMHRQASFYAAQWGEGVEVGPEGDVFAFYLPAIDPAQGTPVLGAGEFVGAFNDRPEVQAVQAYLSTDDWANSRVSLGGAVSANNGLDPENAESDLDKLTVDILQDTEAVFRFDGSDQMPAAVGAGSFWAAMTDWINGEETQTVLDAVESSWPS